MTTRPKQATAKADGEKIKDLRSERTMTQKMLAKAANVTPRTLQRAERGDRVRCDVIGNIANALQVEPLEITVNAATEGTGQVSRPDCQLIRLKRVKSARELAEMIVGIDRIIFESDVEVNSNSAEDIAQMMERIEQVQSGEAGLAHTVAAARDRAWLSFDPSSIKFLGLLQSKIDELALGHLYAPICIFAAAYRRITGENAPVFDLSEGKQFQAPDYTIKEERRLVVRFSQQKVASFSYEAAIGMTENAADQLIKSLKEEGRPVHDLRCPF